MTDNISNFMQRDQTLVYAQTYSTRLAQMHRTVILLSLYAQVYRTTDAQPPGKSNWHE